MNNDCPKRVIESLLRYQDEHCPTGGFLQAVLENNLFEAFMRADDVNREKLFEIVSWTYNNLRSDCYGSKEIVTKWLSKKD